MENEKFPTNSNQTNSRVIGGLIITVFGLILLINQTDLNQFIPNWMTSNKMFIIFIGLIIGATTSFKNPISYVLIILGALLIIKNEFVDVNFWGVLLPIAVISIGIWLLTQNSNSENLTQNQDNFMDWDARQSSGEKKHYHNYNYPPKSGRESQEENASENQNFHTFQKDKFYSNTEYINSTAIFSDVKKIVNTKKLRGGNITNIFGATHLNMMESDMENFVIIEVFQLFAGTKIIVPENWRVISEMVSVFGDVDDRRFSKFNQQDDQKTIILKGTSIFGGITINSH